MVEAGDQQAPDESLIELRKILKDHQDQQLTFLNYMEGIRWKFVAAFGVGAGFTMFVALTKNADESWSNVQGALASPVLAVISLASLVTLIRIYGLVHSTWTRIRALQREEALLVSRLYPDRDLQCLANLFEFPHVTSGTPGWRSGVSHFVTVHIATCAVFCTFLGIAAILLDPAKVSLITVSLAIAIAFLLWLLCWGLSWLYASCLNSQIREDSTLASSCDDR